MCHGVIAARAPHARIIDLTHDVGPQDVRGGSLLLARAVVHLPVAVHLAVVDPGVGTARVAVAAETARGDVLVGPDNGLLGAAAQALGGVTAVHELSVPRAGSMSATFHGRDLFSPSAASIAAGADPAGLGPARDGLVTLPVPGAEVASGRIAAEIALADHFGNLQLAATADALPAAGLVPGDVVVFEHAGDVHRLAVVRTFGDLGPGEPGVLVDSDEHIALTVNGGSAARRFGLGPGDRVVLDAR